MAPKAVKKKSNTMLAILIILIGLLIFAGIFVYLSFVEANTVHLFTRENRHIGAQLYEATLGLDMEENYPESPLTLMRLYNDINFFLYRNIIVNDELFMRVVDLQRELLHPQLIESLTREQQAAHIRNAVETLGEQGVLVGRSEIDHVQYDFYNQRTARVNIRQPLIFYGAVYWVYMLEIDENGQWKIVGWVETDESFIVN